MSGSIVWRQNRPEAIVQTGASLPLVHGQVINITSYGASPSASAATNTAAIQSAADRANSLGGGIVYFPAGTYSISVPGLRLNNYRNVTFQGEGKFATILRDPQAQATAGDMFPTYLGNPTGTRGFFCLDSATNCHVTRIGFKGAGVWYQQAGQSAVDRVGVYFRTSAIDCSVTDCYFTLLEAEVCVTDGISTRCHWDRNTFYRCLVNMINPGGPAGSCTDCTAVDNMITSPGSSALLLNGANNFIYARNTHTWEAGNEYGSDIVLPAQSTGVHILDNLFNGFLFNSGTACVRVGASFQPGDLSGITVARNRFYKCLPLGIDTGIDCGVVCVSNQYSSASYAYIYVGHNDFIECGQSSHGAFGFTTPVAIRVHGTRPITNTVIEYNRVFNGAGAAHPIVKGLQITSSVPAGNTIEVHHNDLEDCATPYDFATLPSFAGLRVPSAVKGVLHTSWAGTPESHVTAAPGSTCADTTNGESYIKHTGTGNTGWKLVTHA